MAPEDLDRVAAAHSAALRISPSARDEFIALQFPDEPELLREVRELLDCSEEAGSFLSTPLIHRFVEPEGSITRLTRIGQYELVRELGQGGSATVFLARRTDDPSAALVAIKLLNRLTHSDEALSRFQREIRILAQVKHPYIVRLLEAGATGEALAFIVMEFVDGKRIDEFAAALPLPGKLQLYVKVCEGVSAAHRNRIVHRDIKPSNILVTADGTPKLLDFGIALVLDDGSRLTATGLERMTIQYASPEQIRREETVASSDVYSLGVLLYELIAERSPFPYPTHELPSRVLTVEPKPLAAPRDLAAVVFKALRKDPAARYQSVEDLRDDVAHFLDGSPVFARTGRGESRIRDFLQRTWKPIAIAAALIVLVLVCRREFVVARDSRVQMSSVSIDASSGRPLSLSLSPDGKRLYYLAGDAFFDYKDLFVKDLESGKVSRITSDGAWKLGPAVSRDGKSVLFSRTLGQGTEELVIMPSAGGPERSLFKGKQNFVAWGPGDQSLIVSYRNADGIWPYLRGFEIRTGQWWDITTPPREGRGDTFPALSPDGKTLCFVRQESRESSDLFLLPVNSNLQPLGTPRRLTSRRLRITQPSWTSDGKEIVYAGGTLGAFHLYRVAVDGRSEPVDIAEAGSGVEALATSLSASSLVFERSKSERNVWQLELSEPGGKAARRMKIATTSDNGSFSPDGRSVAFVSSKSGELQVWIASGNGTNARQLTSYPSPDLLSALWLPDGSGVVTSLRSRTLGTRSFIVPLHGPERELVGVTGEACSFSRDGRWLYFSLIKKDVDIYKISLGTGEIRQVTRDLRAAYAVESLDGRSIYFSTPEPETGLWRVPTDGGKPVRILPNLARRTSFVPLEEGIYYMTVVARSVAIKLRRFSDGQDVELYRTEAVPTWGLSVSKDRRHLLFGQEDSMSTDVVLMANIR